MLAHVRRTVDDARVQVAAVPGEAREPSPVSPVDSPAYVRLARTIRELLPPAPAPSR